MTSDVSRTIEEQLSAFLDGELPDEELQLLVRRLERDGGHRATLERYSFIGNVMRSEPVQLGSRNFRADIMAAIDNETDIVSSPKLSQTPKRPWLIPVASAAAAAMVVVGLMSTSFFPTNVQTNSESLASTNQLQRGPAIVKDRVAPRLATRSGPRLSRRASINSDRLTSYFVSHGELARSFQGPMADSRIFVQQASFEE